MKKLSLFLQIIVVILIAKESATLAPSIKPCPLKSPNLADCVIKSIESLKPEIGTGIYGPNLVADVNLTKLVLSDIYVDRSFKLKLTQIKGYGFNNFKIEKLRINPENFKIDAIMLFPHCDVYSKYALGWNLGIFTLQGSGDLSVSIDNAKVLLKIVGSTYLKNGVEYLKVDTAQINIKSAKMKLYFDNLFNGQKSLEQAANEVINQNLDIIKGEVVPLIEQRISSVILKISNQVFASGTHKEFFPH
ncbi:protein takeout-like [Chironomus tepperi]|uniref:protein takeout-like n=1 Tax=Chironomus tepperi TaxID=113505 RepID=UPI00391FB5CA